MISSAISRVAILIFGTLYPAYASFKAVRAKNVEKYVSCMMYWIVFAIFTCMETFTDLLLRWFPFYYEVKVVLVLWLLSPVTNGSSILYRKFVHPLLKRKEPVIDECIVQIREKGYATLIQLGARTVHIVSNFVMDAVLSNVRLLSQQCNIFSKSQLSINQDGRFINGEDPAVIGPRTDTFQHMYSQDIIITEEIGEDELELPVLSSNLMVLEHEESANTRSKTARKTTVRKMVNAHKQTAVGRIRGRKTKEAAKDLVTKHVE